MKPNTPTGHSLPVAMNDQPLSAAMTLTIRRYASDLATRQCIIVQGDTEQDSRDALQALDSAVEDNKSLNGLLVVWQPLASWSGREILALINSLTDNLISQLTAIALLARESEKK